MIKQNLKMHAIVLARGNSKSIKQKNLKIINEKPLIYWTILDCLKSSYIENVWVSSDNNKILDYSKKMGASIIVRPKSLSKDNSTSESGWLHAIKKIEKENIIKNIMFLQVTSPVRGYSDINEAIKVFFKDNLDSLFSSNVLKSNYFWKKKNKIIKPLYRLNHRKRRQDIKTNFVENGSFYIANVKKFKKFKNRLFGNVGNYNQKFFKGFEIDEIDDLKMVSNILKLHINKKL